MPIQVACPGCRIAYSLTDEFRGKKLRCTRCQNVFIAEENTGTQPNPSVPVAEAAPVMATTPMAEGIPGSKQRGISIVQRVRGLPRAAQVGVIAAVTAALSLLIFGGLVGLYWLIKPSRPTGYALTSEPTGRKRSTAPEGRNDEGPLRREVVQRVKRATVQLHTGDGAEIRGNGFFAIEPGVILTNAHVLGLVEPEAPASRQIGVTLNRGERNEKKIRARLLGVDHDADLAILRADAAGAELPAPLEIKPAKQLLQAQKVFVLGSQSSVSTLSVTGDRRQSGILKRIQVNGTVAPDRSGSPVVDEQGNVIGVAVAAARPIVFALSADQVKLVVRGRVVGLTIGQSFLENGKTTVTTKLTKNDPLGRLRDFAVYVWTGDPGEQRHASDTKPPVLPGDSPHQRMPLNDQGQAASAELTLPPLPAGKVYWFQPTWTAANGKPRWAGANTHLVASSPIERRPATLTIKHQPGNRLLTVKTRSTWIGHDLSGEDRTVGIGLEAALRETLQNVDPQGMAAVRLEYTGLKLEPTGVGGWLPPDRVQRIAHDLPNLTVSHRVDANGMTINRSVDISRIPTASQKEVLEIHDQIILSLDAVSFPWPNREVKPRTSWRLERAVPINALGFKVRETGVLDVTCTYLGTRMHNGRQEAVVGLKGVVRGQGERAGKVSGRIEGAAGFDVAAGQMTRAQAKVSLEMVTPQDNGREARISGNLEVNVSRGR